MSAAVPGDYRCAQDLTARGRRVWLAGEALHETQWGTVNGAWETGQRAAEAALRQIGALKGPDESKPPRRPRERRGRRGQDD
jgi:hypothetical protein